MFLHRTFVIAVVIAGLAAVWTSAQEKNLAERLGYPADAKLLILHADDLGVAHSVDDASFNALDRGAVSSASVIVTAPWLEEVAEYFKGHPDADLGIHLALTSEWKTYRWGPAAPRDQVPSLLAPDGYFYPDTWPAASHAKAEEAEREIRAQLEWAERLGIHPTHLDIHMGTLAARPELYQALIRVAHEKHLPFMAVRVTDEQAKWLSMLAPSDVVLDSLVMFDPKIPASEWTAAYVKALAGLGPGVHEMIVHLGHDDSELEAITAGHPDFGAAWRERDFKAVTSPEFKQALEENHITLIHWKDLGKLLPPFSP
jgi:predicted glycoside hydrolase/deacetylase ChbG (UPF0249 family)